MLLYGALAGAGTGVGASTLLNLGHLFSRPEVPASKPDIGAGIPEKQANIGQYIMQGNNPKTLFDVPIFTPAMVAATGGSLVGGSALVNYLINKRKQKLLDEELARAKSEYDTNVLGTKPEVSKKASALDEVYDILQKDAANGSSSPGATYPGIPPELHGIGTGVALTGAGLLGLFAALGGWKQQSGRMNDELLRKALKKKEYLQSLQSPKPVQVSLTGDVDNGIENPT